MKASFHFAFSGVVNILMHDAPFLVIQSAIGFFLFVNRKSISPFYFISLIANNSKNNLKSDIWMVV